MTTWAGSPRKPRSSTARRGPGSTSMTTRDTSPKSTRTKPGRELRRGRADGQIRLRPERKPHGRHHTAHHARRGRHHIRRPGPAPQIRPFFLYLYRRRRPQIQDRHRHQQDHEIRVRRAGPPSRGRPPRRPQDHLPRRRRRPPHRQESRRHAQEAWLYAGALSPIAQLNAQGDVTARFVYATRANVPSLMIRTARPTASSPTTSAVCGLWSTPAPARSPSAWITTPSATSLSDTEPGLPALRVRGRALRSGHGSGALRRTRLRSGDGALDGQRSNALRRRGHRSLRVCRWRSH